MLESREDYLIRVASLYYEQDYNQEQIAKLLATSRSNVSRLLKEAKQKGLVEIRVRKPITTVPPLEKHFRERFGLERVMIVESRGRLMPRYSARPGSWRRATLKSACAQARRSPSHGGRA